MNINVIGIHDHKIRVGIRNLLNAYAPYYGTIEGNREFTLIGHLIIWDTSAKAIVKDQASDLYVVKVGDILSSSDERTIKYVFLQALFEALCQMTGHRLAWGVLSGIRPTKLVHRYKEQGLTDRLIKDTLMSFYCMSKEKVDELIDIVNHQREVLPNFQKFRDEISVYINIPYCMSRCTYCSFTAYLREHTRITPGQYVDCLCDEIDRFTQVVRELNLKISTVYIGGGTPTALTADELKRVLDRVEKLIEGQRIIEYTLEAGRPDTIDDEKLSLIRDTSVTRISINPQTYNEETLHRVNRQHSVQAIYHCFEQARAFGFNKINMDLIIGLPGEGPEDYLDSLRKTIELDPESITIHSLAIKRKSALRDQYDRTKLSQDFSQAFFLGKEMLKKAGYVPYYLYRQKNIMSGLENIGYGKNGEVSPYNIMMIEEAQTIIGLGCGASSKFLDYELILNPRDLKTYCETYGDYLEQKVAKLKGSETNGGSLSTLLNKNKWHKK